MPNLKSHLDTVGVAHYIIVCDVQNAYHQMPVAESERDTTDFVTKNGKWVFKRLPFGKANAPFLISRIMSLDFAHFGTTSEPYERLYMLLIHLDRPLTAARKYVQSLASSRLHPQTIESTLCPPRS